jgi:L-Lysine epsilon oxidase N-terminal/L-lysine epsilon oxidase C-terminal domain
LAIDVIKIFPPIGIARLGNSPPDWPRDDNKDRGESFIGPEIPGNYTPPAPWDGHYKDSKFRIKRQAARFRLFGGATDAEAGSTDAKEINLADVDIKWTVELANTKAEWRQFGGVEHTRLPLRNATVTNRASLRITPGPRTLDSTEPFDESFFEQPTKVFNTGAFHGVPVSLGEMQTDADGHLLVLGGFGKSASPHNTPIQHFANNDDWYDDISDGPVNASVRLKGTNKWIRASPAWVICAPPKFAPPIEHIITLYDTLLQVAVDRLGFVLPTTSLSFTKDVYPLLARAMDMKWVSSLADVMHRTIRQMIPVPGSTGPAGLHDKRKVIFYHLRNPNTDPHMSTPGQVMPKIWSDVYDVANQVNEALTKIQYYVLQRWRDWKDDKDIKNDWVGQPVPETRITPDGLTRAALESCVGGGLYPGIETSFMTRDAYPFIEPFRLDVRYIEPGDLTKQMAVPWQADFFDCRLDNGLQWWPAQRPEDVFLPDDSNRQWTRQIIRDDHVEDMIDNWHKLGFVVKQGDRYVETERNE